ncbi:MAG: PilW family protein [Desulfohalobiaceae bacterium]
MTRKRHVRQQGMTLIELLVAMACLVLVLAGVYHVFFTQSLSSTAEINILEAQINARAGMQRITHVLRHAGFGCRDSFEERSMTGNAPGGGSVTVNATLWNIQDNTANGTPTSADSVDVVYGFKIVGVTSQNATEQMTVELDDFDGCPNIDPGSNFKDYICFFPYIGGDNFFTVQTAPIPNSDGTLTLDREISLLHENASVYMVAPTRITLDADGDLVMQIFSQGYPSEAANGFQDLQLEYTENGTGWSGVPADPNKVIGVRVWLLARSERGDPGYTDTRTYTYAGQTVGPFNDNIHRWLIEETVWLRNKDQG